MSRLLAGLLLLITFALTSTSATAAPILYAVTRDGALYSIDGATAAATLIGSMGVSASNEIEINQLTGEAYVLYGGLPGSIQQVNLTTAALIGSPVAITAEFSGLEFVGGTLYGTGGGVPGDDIATLNPTTGAFSTIAHPSIINAGGLAYSTATSTMYAIDAFALSFYSIDLVTGARTDISSFAPGLLLGRSLTFGSDGLLYAAGRDDGSLYTVDPTTGNLSLVGNTGIRVLNGLAAAPAAVPEPATLLMLGTGLAGVYTSLRRRRRT